MTVAYWFDLDGTLCAYEEPFEAMLEACLGGERPSAVHETFRRAVFIALEGFDEAPYERGFEAIAVEHGVGLDPAVAAAEFRERELAATVLVPGARAVVGALAERAPVGILTNGDGPMQRAKIERHGLDELVDAVVISNEVGVRKPATGIFDRARERLPADGHVHVGDAYEEDVVGAHDAGFAAIHVRNDDGPAASVDRLASLGVVLGAPVDTH